MSELYEARGHAGRAGAEQPAARQTNSPWLPGLEHGGDRMQDLGVGVMQESEV